MLYRPRRLRVSESVREMVRETRLHPSQLIYPLFVVEGRDVKEEIAAMPGQYHLSVDRLEAEIGEICELRLGGVLIFGLPDHKDEVGSGAYDDEGIVQRAVREIKRCAPALTVITDLCMCQYTSHGHCGILDGCGYVNNDATLPYLRKIALSHARAGADMIAPSDMMDGRVGAIRAALDENGFDKTAVMAYSAKYASSYYGPFREAADSAPGIGDRKTYQMDFANTDEALRECELDIAEGADIIMVKPALAYLDVISRVKRRFQFPLAAYSVSGEYSMLLSAVKSGLLAEEVIEESILAIRRAGADIVITYFAKSLARKLEGRWRHDEF